MKAKKFARLALFLIYFWFGALKVFGSSPANPLVSDMLRKTAPLISPETFITILGLFEIVIGLLFLMPSLTKIAKTFFAIHMVMAFIPLVLLPEIVWNDLFVPTIEGQYIIKNLGLIGLVIIL